MSKPIGNALRAGAAALLAGLLSISNATAQSGEPIKVGLSLALTGAGAAPSKVINTALDIWRDELNAKGGLLGRPVQLVILDDQSTPANVPNIYTKLVTVDKVDLLLGPYGTNFVAPAMPAIIQNKKMTISFTAIGINDKFQYDKYFSMVSVGPEGVNSFSIGFFDMAAAQKPKPETVAILAAANEIGLSPKRMGGAMIGMLVTPIKVQLGPIANGLITGENYAAATAKGIPGAPEFLKRYSEKAAAAGVDPLGFAWGPFAYGAGQVLAQAVTETKSLDHDKLAEYMHKASFKTVAGDFSFAKNGEWSKSRMVWTQVQT